MPPITPAQLSVISTVTRVAAALGFAGSCALFLMYLKHRKNFKNPTGRVLLAIGILDFFDAIAKFAGRWTLSDGPGSVLCQFQAFFLHFSNMSSAFLSLALALNALYLVAFDGSVDLILKLEWLVIAVSLLIPAVIAAIPLFWQPIAGVRMYGDAQLYCWIVSTYTQYQIYLLFMWLWAMIVFTFFVLFYLRYKFNKLDARMASNSSGPTKSSEMRKFVVRRMIAYLIAFVVIWTPSSVNRITQLVIGSPVYELNVFQAMFIPSRGLFDFLANYYAIWSRGKVLQSTTSDSSDSTSTNSKRTGPLKTRHEITKYSAHSKSNVGDDSMR